MATNFGRWIATALAAPLCAVLATAWASPALRAQPAGWNAGVIRGCVAEGTGMPIQGAVVRIVGTAQGAISRRDGSFLIMNVRPGVYTVRATCIGWKPAEMQLLVEPAAQVRLDVTFLGPISRLSVCPWPRNGPLQRPMPYATVRRIEYGR